MRLWTVHPQYLDAKGLVAVWREALLAQKALQGRTRGYRNHPQLVRFRRHPKPDQAIAAFLRGIAREAERRDYRFDVRKIQSAAVRRPLRETEGQLHYEWRHLLAKLQIRAPLLYRKLKKIKTPDAHPLFRIVPGKVQAWEKRR